MLAQLAEHIRTETLATAALTSPVDRSYVAPGDGWAMESCRQFVIAFGGTRRQVVGGGRTPAQQGAGLPGPIASTPVYDFTATFVCCGYPEGDMETPPNADDINTWSLAFLNDLVALEQAMASMALPPALVGVPGLRLSLGGVTQVGPQGGVARVSWPLSVQAAAV